MAESERVRKTKNGVSIYSYKNPALHSFYISLFAKAGCMYEDEKYSGITHFLEHILIRNVNHLYDGELYLFHAPINREHIGIIKIDADNIENSRVVLQAKMHTSCFYPFVQFFADGELAMSYTIARKHIRLARFTLRKYLDK